MDSLKQNIQLLQNAFAMYEEKQNKNTATNLRKVLMSVSKSCGTSRKEVLDHMKAVPKKNAKTPCNSPLETHLEVEDTGNLADSEVFTEAPKPKKSRAKKSN